MLTKSLDMNITKPLITDREPRFILQTGVFFSCCLFVVTASAIFTVVVLNLHHRKPDSHEMSPLVRTNRVSQQR